jgi:putative salt-induced outer membrane protein YdiY
MMTHLFPATHRAASSWLALAGLAATAASLAAAQPKDPTAWETTAAVGFDLSSGNSDTMNFRADVLGLRKWDQNEIRLGGDVSYGETDDERSTENYHAFGQYNRLFAERCYGYLNADARRDLVADVDYRLSLSPGVGYYVIKNDTTSLAFEAGPGLIFEEVGSVSSEYWTLRLAERFEHKFSDRAKLWQSAEYLPQVDRFENYLLTAELGVEAGLTEKLALRAFVQDIYDNEPAPGRKNNDVKFVTQLAYRF